jgi:hypothetical protein
VYAVFWGKKLSLWLDILEISSESISLILKMLAVIPNALITKTSIIIIEMDMQQISTGKIYVYISCIQRRSWNPMSILRI